MVAGRAASVLPNSPPNRPEAQLHVDGRPDGQKPRHNTHTRTPTHQGRGLGIENRTVGDTITGVAPLPGRHCPVIGVKTLQFGMSSSWTRTAFF